MPTYALLRPIAPGTPGHRGPGWVSATVPQATSNPRLRNRRRYPAQQESSLTSLVNV